MCAETLVFALNPVREMKCHNTIVASRLENTFHYSGRNELDLIIDDKRVVSEGFWIGIFLESPFSQINHLLGN